MNLPTTIVIEVTEEDIKNGVRGSCYECPIANAVNRSLELNGHLVRVSSHTLIIELSDSNQLKYGLPFDARMFIKVFDADLNKQVNHAPLKFECQRIM